MSWFKSRKKKLQERIEALETELAKVTTKGLPIVELRVSGVLAQASGSSPIRWAIYAEKFSETRSDVTILAAITDDGLMTQIADLSIHKNGNNSLVGETQAVSASILWSAIRGWRLMQTFRGGNDELV